MITKRAEVLSETPIQSLDQVFKGIHRKIPDPRAYYLIAYASYKLKDYAAAKIFSAMFT